MAALGIRRLQLIDFDDVEATNVTSQGYYAGDLGRPKVTATANVIGAIDPTIDVTSIRDRFRPVQSTGEALFCCVDLIATRAAIRGAVQRTCSFWTDGRMLGEILRILTATEEAGREHYRTSLFQPEEAQTGRCTARSTIYTANLAAALMMHQFTRWLRNLPVDPDVSLNLLASN